jgi:hypothetical protein
MFLHCLISLGLHLYSESAYKVFEISYEYVHKATH